MHRTQIYLPKNQLTALRRLAYKKRTTLSEMIRNFVSQGLQGKPSGQTQASRGQSLFAVLEKIKNESKNSPRDLARNLDTYLYGRG